MRHYGLRIIDLLQNHLDTMKYSMFLVSTDGARIYLSLHVHASDQAKGRDARGIKINYRFVVTKFSLWQQEYCTIFMFTGESQTVQRV
jgi:hypothetical protein